MKIFVFALYSACTLWALFSVIMYGSRPSRSFSWVLTILVFTFLGPLLYYLFGVNRRKFKFRKIKGNIKRRLYDETYKESQLQNPSEAFHNKKEARLAKLIKNSSNMFPYSGNRIKVLNTGKETFDSIFEAIEQAKHFVHVQYFIFEKGALQDRFYKLFKSKVDAGVEVRMIYDSLGSKSFKGELKKRFRKIGVKTYPMMPLRLGSFMYTLNYRNHRKIVIVDGNIGFIGGVNVSDKYIKPISDMGIWADLHLRLEGPVVSSLHRIFIKDYHFASKEDPLLSAKYLPEIPKMGNSIVQILASGPDSSQPTILHQYVGMIGLAKKHIYIANPYFIPGPTVINSIKIAVMSGVKAILLVPGKSDSIMAKYSMYSEFEGLLAVGVKIYLRDDFSHSKVIMIDDEISSVGTGNFDYRSFEHNFETNAVVYDSDIAKRIKSEFEKECNMACQLTYKKFRKRPYQQKFLEGIAKFLQPLL